MKIKSFLSLVLLASLALGPVGALAASEASIPHLAKRGEAVQLIVDDKPFLMLAGELHNSSSTSRAFMKPIWPKLAQMNLNTVLAVVPWDMIEPKEGSYDFSLVDQLVSDARANGLRLVLLWFGSWKNGFSHYVPAWVKADSKRFPRVLTRHGTPEILTPLSEANNEADAKAFAAFMQHLGEIDSQQRTVLMIQVENEVGMHADSRDRSALAEAAFKAPVPAELIAYLKENREGLLPGLRALWRQAGFESSGSWQKVFGASEAAEELFMAWHYARYVDRIAKAGKEKYALPMFVNAWIVQPEDEHPGEYPTGGPQAHVLDVWRAGAPSVDILAPDIYLPNFGEVCAQFARSGSAFFVPESRAGAEGAANAFLAIGAFKAVGYSPFGIESREADAGTGPISRAYDTLRMLSPLILENQARGSIAAFSLTQKNTSQILRMGDVALRAGLLTERRSGQMAERGYALVLQTGPDEFTAAGCDLQLSFSLSQPDGITLGLDRVEEGVFEEGRWVAGRRLNGDEVMLSYDVPATAASRGTGTGLKFPNKGPVILRVKLYRYPQAK